MKGAIADTKYAVYCVRIEPITGTIIYLTNHPRDLTMNGNVYQSDAGYDFTGIQSESSFSPTAIDLSGILDIAGLDYDLISSGVYDNARVYCFKTTYSNPTEDEEEIGAGLFGRITFEDERYKVQVMMLIDVLNQSVGDTYQASCQKVLGSQTYAGCMVTLASYTVTGTITSRTSNSVFRDNTRAEAADYFGAGLITFTSGDNVGLKAQEIKTYAANGTITLHEPFYYDVQIGDTYSMSAGCRKREQEDCITKFNNIENFGGFSFVPTKSVYVRGGVDK